MSHDITSKLQAYISEELLFDQDQAPEADQSLIRTGILDSLSLLQLIGFIEEQFGIEVQDEDVNPQNFETIVAMKAFIEGKPQKS